MAVVEDDGLVHAVCLGGYVCCVLVGSVSAEGYYQRWFLVEDLILELLWSFQPWYLGVERGGEVATDPAVVFRVGYSGDVHLSFKPKLKGISGRLREVIYLSWDELKSLYDMKIESRSLSSVRDVFCFCCFTGLRYSDVATLKKVDVHDTHISVVTEKTDEVIKIELNKYSRAILDKYKDIPLPDDLALPVISNQKMNVHLKDLAKLAGLTEPVRLAYFKGNQRYEEVKPKHDLDDLALPVLMLVLCFLK